MYTVEFLSYFVFLSLSFVSSTVECSSIYVYATRVFRHDSSRPMLSHVEPRRRCECECVIHVSVHMYILVMSTSISIFLFLFCFVCCMLECLYVCCLCVLIIPLVTRAWHVGNPRHVTCRVYIDMHLSCMYFVFLPC